MKKQFAEHGAASMSDIQFLEMLLFYAIPRRDTNVLAHALLDRFNSLRGVLDADPSELERVEGIGENAAIFLKTVREALPRLMAGVASLKVPLVAEVGVADNWEAAH